MRLFKWMKVTLMCVMMMLWGCNAPSKFDTDTGIVADDSVSSDSADSEDSGTEPTFDPGVFVTSATVGALVAATYKDGVGPGYCLALSPDGSLVAIGDPFYNNNSGSIAVFQTSLFVEGAVIYSSNADLFVEGVEGGYLGLQCQFFGDYLLAASEGASNGNGDIWAGQIHAIPLDTTGIVNVEDVSVLDLRGSGENAYLEVRCLSPDGTMFCLVDGFAQEVYFLDASYLDGSYNNGDLAIDVLSPLIILDGTYTTADWPGYSVLQPEEDGNIFVGAPMVGDAEVWTPDGTNLVTTIKQYDHRFGIAMATVPDLNGDGVLDILVGAPGYDYVVAISGSNGSTLGVIQGPTSWNGSRTTDYWGASIATMEVMGETLVLIGAFFGTEQGSGSGDTGSVDIYTLSDFLNGNEPFTTVYGNVDGSELGRVILPTTDVAQTLAEACFFTGAAGDAQVYRICLSDLVEL